MTWGTHCPKCGNEFCSWDGGAYCEGMLYPNLMDSRHKWIYNTPWWKKLFTRNPHRKDYYETLGS